MKKAFVVEERCKECETCILVCPKKCIEISKKLNSKGYHPIVIDQEKCIGCGLCVTVCPDIAIELWEVEEVGGEQ